MDSDETERQSLEDLVRDEIKEILSGLEVRLRLAEWESKSAADAARAAPDNELRVDEAALAADLVAARGAVFDVIWDAADDAVKFAKGLRR